MAKRTSADKPSKLLNLPGSGETLLTIEELVANDINAKVEQHVLCPKCRDVVSQSYILQGRERRVKETLDPSGCEERLEQFVHYPSKEELQTSAVWGKCHLCTLLWVLVESDVKKAEESEESEEESEPMTYGPTIFHNSGPQIKQEKRYARARKRQKRAKHAARGSPPSPGIIFQICCSDPNLVYINIEVNGHIGFRVETNGRRCLFVKPIGPKDKEKEWEANRDDPIDNHHDAQVSISTASNGSFSLAKQWIDQCLKEHSLCRETSMSSSRLPTRLVDVGASAGDISLRLCITNTLHEQPVLYLALSHHWGGAEILRLLEMNVEAFLQNIPEDELPLTFRDAIKITRRLGYRYLWIDSLCIIQDSAKDWELESAFMGDIYRGSVCTISALGAEDSHGGCFTTRNPLQYRPCRLTGDANKGMVARGSSLGNRLGDGPLLKRAWVVQERMLSPRTYTMARRLSFGNASSVTRPSLFRKATLGTGTKINGIAGQKKPSSRWFFLVELNWVI